LVIRTDRTSVRFRNLSKVFPLILIRLHGNVVRGDAMSSDEYMSVKDAANFLKVTEKTVINRINRGEIEGIQEGRFWKVGRQSVEKAAKEDSVNLPKDSGDSEVIQILKAQLQERTTEASELREQVAKLTEDVRNASERHDTVVIHLTRQMEQSQRLLEYNQEPWYRRMFRKGRKEKID